MALDAPWVVSFKCVVKGYQDCRFDMKEGEDQSFKEISEQERERPYFSNCKRARTIRSPHRRPKPRI